jgi:hypothetical protein
MTYLKSTLVGIAAAFAASVIWILTMLVLPIAAPFLVSRMIGTGAVGAGAVVGSGSILIAGLVGFILGFSWQFRRASRSPATGPAPRLK